VAGIVNPALGYRGEINPKHPRSVAILLIIARLSRLLKFG
jgi:hypothetical protein